MGNNGSQNHGRPYTSQENGLGMAHLALFNRYPFAHLHLMPESLQKECQIDAVLSHNQKASVPFHGSHGGFDAINIRSVNAQFLASMSLC